MCLFAATQIEAASRSIGHKPLSRTSRHCRARTPGACAHLGMDNDETSQVWAATYESESVALRRRHNVDDLRKRGAGVVEIVGPGPADIRTHDTNQFAYMARTLEVLRAASSAANFAVEAFGGASLPRPQREVEVLRMSMSSPWYITIATSAPASVILYWLLRHPGDVGAWLPRVRSGWVEGMSEVDASRRKRMVDSGLDEGEADRVAGTVLLRESC